MKMKSKIVIGTALINTVCFSANANEEMTSKPISEPVNNDLTSGKTILFGDFLWWQANANDVPFVTKQTTTDSGASKQNITLDGNWDPGFRVGAGYRFGFYSELDLMLTYTRFYGKSEQGSETADSFSPTDAQFLRQNWISFLGPITLTASGEWNVLLNVGDIEIGRRCNVRKHLWFRPHGGVRLAWVDFKYNANYTGLWAQADETFATQATSMNASSYFNSGGLRAGSQFGWDFCRNVGLVADIGASLLYGHFKVNESFNGGDTVETGSLIPVTETYKETMNGVRANLDILLGLKGSVGFYGDRCCFSLFAGYELSQWFRVNELFQVVRTIDVNDNATYSTIYSSNDISFQGLTMRASLAF